jgi:hypothetical protein
VKLTTRLCLVLGLRKHVALPLLLGANGTRITLFLSFQFVETSRCMSCHAEEDWTAFLSLCVFGPLFWKLFFLSHCFYFVLCVQTIIYNFCLAVT